MADVGGNHEPRAAGMSEGLVPGPGQRLRTARESLGVSPREVADALNLPLRVITALETDDYEGMPPSVFSRGYLRSYARLLELDAEALLAAYPEVQSRAEATGEMVAVAASPRPELLRAVGVGAAVVVVITIAVILLAGGEETVEVETSEVEAAVQPLEAFAPSEDENRSDSPRIGTDAGTTRMERNDSPAQPVARPLVAQAPAVAPTDDVQRDVQPLDSDSAGSVQSESPARPAKRSEAADASPRQMVAPIATGVRRITETGNDVLRFGFTEECWVEVKSMEGVELYSDLNRAGRSLELVGDGPFRILLGYAPGVTLAWNDESVPLTAYTRNNVANLVVGQ